MCVKASVQMSRIASMGARAFGVGGRKGGICRQSRTVVGAGGFERSFADEASSRTSRRIESESCA